MISAPEVTGQVGANLELQKSSGSYFDIPPIITGLFYLEPELKFFLKKKMKTRAQVVEPKIMCLRKFLLHAGWDRNVWSKSC